MGSSSRATSSSTRATASSCPTRSGATTGSPTPAASGAGSPFSSGGGFNVAGLARALAEEGAQREKLLVLLNFPNNPTGYVPTRAEGEAIVRALQGAAARGTRVVASLD